MDPPQRHPREICGVIEMGPQLIAQVLKAVAGLERHPEPYRLLAQSRGEAIKLKPLLFGEVGERRGLAGEALAADPDDIPDRERDHPA
jgi:hypothetical protein